MTDEELSIYVEAVLDQLDGHTFNEVKQIIQIVSQRVDRKFMDAKYNKN